jgi:dolichyl-phosphate-mannose-protein mannosyltransferase
VSQMIEEVNHAWSLDLPKGRKAIFKILLLITAMWLLGIALVDPRGDFPLDDDWAYGRAVQTLLDTGSVRLHDWAAPNFIAQMFWGAIFCLPAGFSFTALRISTLVLGLIGIFAQFGLLREGGLSNRVALFGALSLAVSPFYVELSNTFMTDVPFVAFCLLALYFLVRGIRGKGRLDTVAGLVFACIALLIRQAGIAIFIAASIAHLATNRWKARTALIAIVPLLLGAVTQFLYQGWLRHTQLTPAGYDVQIRVLLHVVTSLSGRTLVLFIGVFISVMTYLGLFSIPSLMLLGLSNLRQLFRCRPATGATCVFAILAAYYLRNRRIPLLPDVLYDFGLGHPLLYDTETLHLRHGPHAGVWFWLLLTLAGWIGAVVLFQATLFTLKEACDRRIAPAKRRVLVLLLATGMVYAAPVLLLGIDKFVFDRYCLVLVPLAVFILFSSAPHPGDGNSRFMLSAVASLVLYGMFSIAGTHDYLAWNRVRWLALNELMQEQNVDPSHIDGGFEFNGWYLYSRSRPNQLLLYVDELTQSFGKKAKTNVPINSNKSWWWVDEDDYVVSFGPVAGFITMKLYEFQRWLPPGNGTLLLLHKTANTPYGSVK